MRNDLSCLLGNVLIIFVLKNKVGGCKGVMLKKGGVALERVSYQQIYPFILVINK